MKPAEKEIQQTGGEVFAVAEEVAIPEVKKFVEYHQDITISDDRSSDQFIDIATKYKAILKAVKRSNLNLSDLDKPVLKLQKPILSDGGNFNTDEIKFTTRITKSKMAQITKGFDIGGNLIGYTNIMTTYYTNIGSTAMLDKFGKTDLAVIDEMVALFQ